MDGGSILTPEEQGRLKGEPQPEEDDLSFVPCCQIWERAASEMLDIVGRPFLDDIDKIIHESGAHILPLSSSVRRMTPYLQVSLCSWRHSEFRT